MFQYPQADRRGCNPISSISALNLILVSVSTSGSKGVQPTRLISSMKSPIVSVSTSGSKGVQLAVDPPEPPWIRAFQYPQADRRGCNRDKETIKLIVAESFSIHKRIEGGATCLQCERTVCLGCVSVSTSGSKGVQQSETQNHPGSRPVSVSTSGSKGVQQRIHITYADPSMCFSIHKRIEEGATPQFPAPGRGCSCFSIHKRIEGGATRLPALLFCVF